MKRILIVATAFIMLTTGASAQDQFALGIRYGGTSGLTLKYYHANSAIEGIVGIWNQGTSFTGIYEKYPGKSPKSFFNWYYGVGAHTSVYSRGNSGFYNAFLYRDTPYRFNESLFALGFDVLLGLELKSPSFPLVFCIEIKPFLEFASYGQYWVSYDPGIGLKAYF
jgi:hypothetical protein